MADQLVPKDLKLNNVAHSSECRGFETVDLSPESDDSEKMDEGHEEANGKISEDGEDKNLSLNGNSREQDESSQQEQNVLNSSSNGVEASDENEEESHFPEDVSGCEESNTIQKNVEEAVEVHDCLKHNQYLTLCQEYHSNLAELNSFQMKLQSLENTVEECKSLKEQLALLNQKCLQQERELELSRQEHDLDGRAIAGLKKELESVKKQYETANKERESIVIRYAMSEKELMDVKKERSTLEAKLKDAVKEHESLMTKIKTVANDKAKISQTLDNKSAELAVANKELERLKDEINSRDIKIKWAQNKVKTEMELHKDCPGKIEKLQLQICDLERELSDSKEEINKCKKEIFDSEQNKIVESNLQEERAKLILERHEHIEREAKLKSLQIKNEALIEENNNLSFQVQNLEQERFDFEKKFSGAREEVRVQANTMASLQSRIVELESLANLYQQEKDKIENINCEIERLRKSNEELINDMALCRNREAEMLAFTQKLTTKNVQLQSEFSAVEAKAAHLSVESQKSEEVLSELRSKLEDAERLLNEEKSRRSEERLRLARELAESRTREESLEAALKEAHGDLSVMKNKHATTVRELQRELQQYRKKLDNQESESQKREHRNSLNDASRASSVSSLNEGHTSSVSSTSINTKVEYPASQALVDKVVRLQDEAAKLQDRIEFLEDHSGQLVAELQKKSKLLQSYILREQAGALASSRADKHKAEVTKHGGIMASLYGSRPADDTMTLELSLEINHKLQAILEDTLLKNITLKESIDTLGDEIARLKSTSKK